MSGIQDVVTRIIGSTDADCQKLRFTCSWDRRQICWPTDIVIIDAVMSSADLGCHRECPGECVTCGHFQFERFPGKPVIVIGRLVADTEIIAFEKFVVLYSEVV